MPARLITTPAEARVLAERLGVKVPTKRTVRADGFRSKTEAMYAAQLEAERRYGAIVHYGYEEVKLRIGNRCWYTPDFVVLPANAYARLELHEVKGGYAREKSIVKLKAAAARYPFIRFVLAVWDRGVWTVTEVKAR